MREILFRGKRIDNGDFVFGMPWIFEDHACICPWDKGMCKYDTGYYPVPVIPETVGQYTGVTDKNGKRIFEGDIIKIPDDYDEFGINAGEIYEIYFAFGGFRLKPKHSRARGFWLEDDETVEIIGNIHDNPEKEKGRG